jgi:hypothetical protein
MSMSDETEQGQEPVDWAAQRPDETRQEWKNRMFVFHYGSTALIGRQLEWLT